MQERWKDIELWSGYSVSNLGKILNKHKNRVIKQSIDKDGYYVVNLEQNGIRKKVSVRRLVALAFIPNRAAFVQDRDGNKLNNYINNLFWSDKRNTENNNGPRRLSEKSMSIEEFEKKYFDDQGDLK